MPGFLDSSANLTRPMPGMITTAGDWERESRSRRWNLLEGLGVMAFVLIVLWPFGYVGVLKDIPAIQTVANIFLVTGAVYLLFVSPFLHRDTADSWGLGNPKAFWRLVSQGNPDRRALIAIIAALLFVGLNYINVKQWPEVAHFFNFKELARFFHLEVDVMTLNQSFPGLFVVIAFGSLLAGVIVTSAIRYDNFLPAFGTALKVSLPLLALTFLAAFLHRGTQAFENMSLSKWALGVFGYVFWGFVQQLLFSSYFGTRFRKGFAPSASPNNVIRGTARTLVVTGAGTLAVVGVAIFAAVAMRLAGKENDVPPVKAILLLLLLFPLGAAYGFFLCRDIKRMLVATLTAFCFGLIHIASYGLVAVTWMLGIILVYVFMESKNRNLVALGFIHGLLGSTFGQLFSHGSAGSLNVNYSVGPWNIHHPTVSALFIPLACIALFLCLMIWAARTIRE